MSKKLRINIMATVVGVLIAVGIGSLLKNSQHNNSIKIERAITFTGNEALQRGYVCGAARLDIEECRAELWKNGTPPLKVYGEIR